MESKRKSCKFIVFVLAFSISFSCFLAFSKSMDVKAENQKITEAREIMLAMKAQYPEGMQWTNNNFYAWKGGYFSGGYGCAAFAFMLSDAVFGDKQCVIVKDYTHVKVGDIVRINNDTHSVIVLNVYDNYIVEVAEGNYNSAVHWGRMIDLKNTGFSYLMTRWADSDFNEETIIQPEPEPEPEPEPVPTKKITQSMIDAIPDCIYTGGVIRPSIVVKDGSKTLQEGKDYTLEFVDNTNIGQAAVFVYGKGNYYDYAYRTFNILSDATPSKPESDDNNTILKADKMDIGVTYDADLGEKNGYIDSEDWYSFEIKQDCDVAIYIGNYANLLERGTSVELYDGKGWHKTYLVSNYLDNLYIASDGKYYRKNYLEKGTYYINLIGGATFIEYSLKVCTIPSITYRTQVQKEGWQAWKKDGELSGTKTNRRLEGIQIKLKNAPYSGGVWYKTYIQKRGWEAKYAKNGALSGTTGQALRLEAIQIKLTGKMNENYTVCYRTYVEKFGWLGWAKNGEKSGTAGYSAKLEGIQIKLVGNGEKIPKSSVLAFRKK